MNKIDTNLTEGYGQNILQTWKQLEKVAFQTSDTTRLPLIAGRDCSGEVVDIGSNVRNVRVSDEVIAVVPGTWQGTHAEYVVTKSNAIAPKPFKISHVEAASMPFVACTAWAALVTVSDSWNI